MKKRSNCVRAAGGAPSGITTKTVRLPDVGNRSGGRNVSGKTQGLERSGGENEKDCTWGNGRGARNVEYPSGDSVGGGKKDKA